MGSTNNTGASSTRKKVAFFPVYLSERECPIGVLFAYAPTFKIPDFVKKLFVSGSALSDPMLLSKFQESNVTSLMLDLKSTNSILEFIPYTMSKLKSLHLTYSGDITFHSNLDESTDDRICRPHTDQISRIQARQLLLREGTGFVGSTPVESVLECAWAITSLHISNMSLSREEWRALCVAIRRSSYESSFESLIFDFVACDFEHLWGLVTFDEAFLKFRLKHLTLKWLHKNAIWTELLRMVLSRSTIAPLFHKERFEDVKWEDMYEKVLESITLMVPSLSELGFKSTAGTPSFITYAPNVKDLIIYVKHNQFNQAHFLVKFLNCFRRIRSVTIKTFKAPEYIQDLGFCFNGNYACTTFEEFKEYISKNVTNTKLFKNQFPVRFEQVE